MPPRKNYPRPTPAISKHLSKFGPTAIFFTILLVAWELFAHTIMEKAFAVPNYFLNVLLPKPSTIAAAFLAGIHRWPINISTTLQEVLTGFLAGSIAGVLLGILIAYSRVAEKVVYPMAIFVRSAPLVALAPIFTLWFGRGLESKIAIVALIAFFPVMISTALGIRSVEVSMLDLLKSLSATELKIFYKVQLPSAMPYIFAGLKIAISTSVTGAIVAEFVGASDVGLGNMAMIAMQYNQTARIFAILGILSALGLSLFGFVSWMERLVASWKTETSQTVLR